MVTVEGRMFVQFCGRRKQREFERKKGKREKRGVCLRMKIGNEKCVRFRALGITVSWVYGVV
jgi:hypothetical protein